MRWLVYLILMVLLSTTVSAGPLDSLKEFSDRVGETVSITFQKIGKFIEAVELFTLNVYFFVLVLAFFSIIAMMFTVPAWVHRKLVENKKILSRFYNRYLMD